jgi:hypothetical protein
VNRSSLVITLVALATGCTQPAPAESARHFCLALYGALYDRRAACESWSAAYQELAGATAAECEFVAQTVADGRERFDPAWSGECLRDLKAAFASVPCLADEPPIPSACDQVLRPAVPPASPLATASTAGARILPGSALGRATPPASH